MLVSHHSHPILPANLAVQESMRLHPIVYWLLREAGQDDVIPLAFPITTKSGKQITSIPVMKGTTIDIAINVYNR
jgi:hypothetical protein